MAGASPESKEQRPQTIHHSTMWDTIKHELIERFTTFETAKGIYLVVLGLALLFHQQYIISVLALLAIVEGVRKLFVNRTKQAVRSEQMKARRIERKG